MHLRTDATSLFSLMRNIGSSIGISIMFATLSHNMQVNHAELAVNASPFSAVLRAMWPAAAAGNPTALMQLDGLINQQALMISYVDDFKLMMLVTLCAIPLVLILKKPARRPVGPRSGRCRPTSAMHSQGTLVPARAAR